MIVVDTNVLAYLLLGGEKTPQERAAFVKDPEWAAPRLWRSEFRSVLAGYLRRGHLTAALARSFMGEAEALLGEADYEPDSNDVLRAVASSRCSSYDCEFVALAEALRVTLVTCDRQILDAFPTVAVSLDVFSTK
ncbi:MAG TPA: type II toxin-antitoxin system VapC family toxin [Candidatus Hydrogenedentes bacterium]|nr:type II toxin-antitoxin system VapC family toxin [Candidatus Hydrogenedentota bacterium]